MRIILVDDEPYFLEQMAAKLERFGAELHTAFEVAAFCYSGEEALQRIGELTPDAVFTDIRMASLDGIELAKSIQERWPGLPVIVISGYSLFEYALEAMRAGVTDYLLKPIDGEALRKTLLKLMDQTVSVTYERAKNVWLDMLGHSIGSDEAGSFGDARPTAALPYPLYRAAIIQNIGDVHDEVALMPQLRIDDEAFRTAVIPMLDKNEEVWLLATIRGRETWLILGLFTDNPVKLNAILQYAQSSFARNGQLPTLAYSEAFPQPRQLGNLSPALRRTLQASIVIGRPRLVAAGDRSNRDRALQAAVDEKLFVRVLEKNNIPALREHFLQCMTQWKNEQHTSLMVEMNLKRVTRLLEQHYRLLDAASGKTLEVRIEEMVSAAASFEELAEACWAMIAKLFRLAEGEVDYSDSSSLFSSIESYIHANIGQPLTLQMLTDRFRVSSTLLCNLFRDYSDKSFVEYVTAIRMNKAMEYMRAYPQMRNKDIADVVGYADQNYFSRVFKTIVGRSPTEFRAELRGEGE